MTTKFKLPSKSEQKRLDRLVKGFVRKMTMEFLTNWDGWEIHWDRTGKSKETLFVNPGKDGVLVIQFDDKVGRYRICGHLTDPKQLRKQGFVKVW